jgi:hypothetical protein
LDVVTLVYILGNITLMRLFILETFQAIQKGHENQRLLVKILVETSGDTESRSDNFKELKE